MWRNLAIETTGRYYSYYKYTCKSMYGIQESRLRACIYGSHFAYKNLHSKFSRQRNIDGRKRSSNMAILMKTLILITFKFKLRILIFKIYF